MALRITKYNPRGVFDSYPSTAVFMMEIPETVVSNRLRVENKPRGFRVQSWVGATPTALLYCSYAKTVGPNKNHEKPSLLIPRHGKSP